MINSIYLNNNEVLRLSSQTPKPFNRYHVDLDVRNILDYAWDNFIKVDSSSRIKIAIKCFNGYALHKILHEYIFNNTDMIKNQKDLFKKFMNRYYRTDNILLNNKRKDKYI